MQVDEDSIVGAVGNTEFGRFVSLGMLKDVTSATTPSVQLTLARRYVSDEDERAKWVSPTQPLKALSEKAGVQEWVGVLETPWKIL